MVWVPAILDNVCGVGGCGGESVDGVGGASWRGHFNGDCMKILNI